MKTQRKTPPHGDGEASPGGELATPDPEREAVEARERKAISAQVVYQAILTEGENELARPTSALAFSGLAAGLSMGFSFLTQGFLQAQLPDTAWASLIARLGYSIGFCDRDPRPPATFYREHPHAHFAAA